MRIVQMIATALVIIGALNWGLVAIAEYDLVASLAGLEFGETNAFTRIVYGLVGISALGVATVIPLLGESMSKKSHAAVR